MILNNLKKNNDQFITSRILNLFVNEFLNLTPY